MRALPLRLLRRSRQRRTVQGLQRHAIAAERALRSGPASATVAAPAGAQPPHARASGALAQWWPLAALTLLAAALRLSTLDLQSLWYDEAFTPVHVLHPSLGATLHAVVHTENTPPLWYVLEWAISRVLGHRRGRAAAALGARGHRDRAGRVGDRARAARPPRRAAIAAAALVAVNPLFVWYSQEARAYGLFVLTAALAMLCFLRALREPDARGGWRRSR